MSMESRVIHRDLIQAIRKGFALNWKGIHGAPHWARVRENGLRIASLNGANPRVIELFAFLHDSQRHSDGRDPQHGERAADFVKTLQGVHFDLPPEELELLCLACLEHSNGLVTGDVTVLTCWDADRLDLGRVDITPEAKYLCTAEAKNPKILEWAYARSLG